jgi:hypothetical protein
MPVQKGRSNGLKSNEHPYKQYDSDARNVTSDEVAIHYSYWRNLSDEQASK